MDQERRGDGPGELGDDLPAIDLGTGRTATAITAGGSHACALLDNAQVKCWGENSGGQLGLCDTTRRGDGPEEMGNSLPAVDLGASRTATAITAGGSHTCALLDNNQVKCWGDNFYGQLGLGDTTRRGDGPGEMGDALPAIALGTGRTATAITAGWGHTCALLDNNQVKCWGENSHVQLGLGDTDHRGDAPAEMDDALPAIALGTGRTATAITAGWGHTCARLDDGVRKCWGGNIRGELGLGDRTNRGNGPGEMGDALLPANGVPAMSVTILADHTAVEAGEDIGYDVTVTNTGTTLLSQIRVQAPDVPDCAANPPDLLPGQQHVVECSYTTTPDDVPQMTNQVLVTSRQADPVLSGTRRTRVIEEAIRPDAQIRVGNGAFIGTTTYNTTGSGQSRSATVGNQGTATFTGRIQNDGNVTDDITLLGQPTTSRYTVTYKDGPTNITAQVTAGTYTIDDLAPGATHDITIQIKAKAGTPVGNQVTRTLTATSGADPDLDDTVKTTVRRT